MVLLTMDLLCIYMYICLSTLTLIASLMALYILNAKYEERERRIVKAKRDKEVRQAQEPTRPICVPQL